VENEKINTPENGSDSLPFSFALSVTAIAVPAPPEGEPSGFLLDTKETSPGGKPKALANFFLSRYTIPIARKMEFFMKQNAFLRGIADGFPICLGYLSVAFAFGIFAVGQGLNVWETVLISLTNVTSAGQLAGVPIMVGGGTLIEMAASQFIINLRYTQMSVSLSQKLARGFTLPHRMAVAFVNTDEVFAVSSAQKGLLGRPYMYGLILTPYFGWALGTLLGAVAGDILPEIVTSSLGIAIYGMFIAIVIPEAKASRATALCAGISVALSCLFYYVPGLNQVPSGFVIILCAVTASAILAIVSPLPVEEREEDSHE